jgi:polysaccharide pyruvyl transferase WcaK-like protein
VVEEKHERQESQELLTKRTPMTVVENHLIEHRDKIFDASNRHYSYKISAIPTYNKDTQKILEQIKALRQQAKESKVTSDEWRAKLIEKV